MLQNGCEAGCIVFTGGEIKHDKDCQYYQESLSKMYDDLQSEIKKLRIGNIMEEKTLRKHYDYERLLRLLFCPKKILLISPLRLKAIFLILGDELNNPMPRKCDEIDDRELL